MMKHIYRFIFTICISFMLLPATVFAAGKYVNEYFVRDNQIVMFVAGIENTPSQIAYQIGSTPCDITDVQLVGQGDSIIHTIVLLDNSKSVMTKHGDDIKSFLLEMVANRAEGEYFTIATLSKDVSFHISGTNDYVALKSTIEEIPIENKDAYVVENVYDILQSISQVETPDFYRLLVISDGVDSADVGVSLSELISYIEKNPYPIYTIGTGGTSNDVTKNLFSISRAVNTSYYAIDGENATPMSDILSTLRSDAVALRISATIPAELRNGSTMNSQLTIDGQNYECEFTMPFSIKEDTVEQVEEKITVDVPPIEENSVSANENTTQKSGASTMLIAIAIAIIVIAFVVAGLLLFSSKKKKEEEEKQKQLKKRLDQAYGDDRDDGEYTLLGDTSETVLDSGEDDSDFETRLIGRGISKAGKNITFRRVDDPQISYNADIIGVISVGRLSAKTITIHGDSTVSGHHCEVFIADGDVYIKNANQSNGTRVNERKINEPTVINTGDKVTIGSHEYEIIIM